MNDRYVFAEEKLTNNNPFTLVFENKDLEFPIGFTSCNELNQQNKRYIKKDGKCIEIYWHDKEYKYLDTPAWLIYNTWLDLYSSGSCNNE